MDAHVNVMKCIGFDAQLNGVYSDIYFINIAITYNFLLRLQLTCKTLTVLVCFSAGFFAKKKIKI